MDSGVQRLLHPLCPLLRPRWFLCPQTNLTAPRQGALCEYTPAHTRALPPPLPRAMFSGHRSAGARVSRGLRPSGGGQVPSNTLLAQQRPRTPNPRALESLGRLRHPGLSRKKWFWPVGVQGGIRIQPLATLGCSAICNPLTPGGPRHLLRQQQPGTLRPDSLSLSRSSGWGKRTVLGTPRSWRLGATHRALRHAAGRPLERPRGTQR